ncbi:MAG: P1 family peptidase [Coriobacteriales bacterium]|jgi:L-aminopeptidase/D-esterase-like protein|nr:P1 family peptidase [Coriobacteriales bacterium]
MTDISTDFLPIRIGSDAVLPEGFLLGHAQDEVAGTGCTAIICAAGAIGGVSVRGAAPATRETDLLDPRNSVERANAVVLSGGSAFGLDSSGGVMRWLAERGIGFNAGPAVVPIVCSACIFDLGVGGDAIRPYAELGYAACEAADTTADGAAGTAAGNIGAGTGASVGKLLGETCAMKGGFGIASAQLEELVVTAVVAVNALGNVYDRRTGQALAGTRDPQNPQEILNPYQAFSLAMASAAAADGDEGHSPGVGPGAGTNTTIGCVLTNGALTKAQAARVADRAHDGLARAIDPIHTSFDGDALFALSTAELPGVVPDLLGALATSVMEAAVVCAIQSAQGAYGLPAASDLNRAQA